MNASHVLAIVLIALSATCGKKSNSTQTPDPPPNVTPGNDTIPGWVIATNGASKRIEVYDGTVIDWNRAEAKKWSWSPTTAAGFPLTEVNDFGGGADAKLRIMKAWGDSTFLAVADQKMAAIVSYPGAVRKWSQALPGNVHSAEILPNGNIAIAASDGNWVRVYCSSQGINNATFVQYNLNQAHAVLWDSANNLLWVTGQEPASLAHILTALQVGGTAAAPTLTEVTAWRSTLPSAWGHDIAPYYGDMTRLWVSTNGGVYMYSKTTKSFVAAPGGSNRSFVKAVTNFSASGAIVQTQPDANKSPLPTVNCTLNGWSTSTVEFFTSSGSLQTSRAVIGACFYKARVFNTPYQ